MPAAASGVHQQEAAGAVGVLGHARREAGLAEQRGLLVARRCRRAGSRPPSTRDRLARASDRGHDSGSSARGMPSRSSSSSSQSPVAMSRAACGRRSVASVTCARRRVSLQASQQSTVPKASSPRSARARSAGRCRAASASLVPEKYGSSSRPVRARDRARGRRLEPLAEVGGAPVLPDDRGRDRPPRGAIPDDRRLALVGDADGDDVDGRCARAGQHLARSARPASPRSPRRRARPSPDCGKCCVNSRCAVATTRRRGRTRSSASSSCPGPGRARIVSCCDPPGACRDYYIAAPAASERRVLLASQASSRAGPSAGTCSASLLRR